MTPVAFILLAGATIVVIGTAAFILVVINIRAVDRSKRLMQEPGNVFDAATRRILGTRTRRSGLSPIEGELATCGTSLGQLW